MRVVLIGSGNVATVLGRLIRQAGHDIVQVYSRNIKHAQALAMELEAQAIDDFGSLEQHVEFYIVAISDTGLYTLNNQLRLSRGILVHTAGSVPMNVLERCSANHGVLYPLQTLRKEMVSVPAIPLFVEANTADDLCLLEEFAGTISTQVSRADSGTRMKWHIGAVIVSNFTNMLYAATENFCKAEGLDFLQLKPLITETAARLGERPAAALQTGPAIRNDQVTIDKHLAELVVHHPELARVYEYLSNLISNKQIVRS